MKRYISLATRSVNDEDFNSKFLIARNPTTRARVLEKLIEDKSRENDYVRSYVAGNPNTTEAMLRELSADNFYRVRSEVAANPNTPEDILREFYRKYNPDRDDFDKEIMQNLKHNPSTPADILEKLDSWVSDTASKIMVYCCLPPDNMGESVKYVVDSTVEALGYESQGGEYVDDIADNPNSISQILDELNYNQYYVEYWGYCELIGSDTDWDKIANTIKQRLTQLGYTDISIDGDEVDNAGHYS